RDWLAWASRSGVDGRVVSFIDDNPEVFASSNGRSWTYVSNVLKAWEQTREGELLPLVAGLVGMAWAVAFLRHYNGKEKVLSGEQVAGRYAAHRKIIQEQVRAGRLDAVRVTIEKLKEHLVTNKGNLKGDAAKNVARFLGDLPGDLRIGLRSWLAQNGL